jgi:putative DNA primase/helicase
MISLACSEEGIPVLPEQLDADPWLLNCVNGTLDLRTGFLRGHRRGDLITKLAPVEYVPDSPCPQWQRFLNDVFEGNAALVGFVRRLLGYCLTGDVREHVLPIFWGVGANGKSTLINVMLALLGTGRDGYAYKANRDLLMAVREKHSSMTVALYRRRFVACVEAGQRSRLDEGLVKELTGGDVMTGRYLYGQEFNFAPTHKAILVTNHRPEVAGTDEGIWRRPKLVPFNRSIPDAEQDKALPGKLLAELPGILADCVRGCLEWQRDGLAPPPEVELATADYRAEQDILGHFLEECCQQHRDLRTRASDLYARYQKWAKDSGEDAVSQRAFGLALKERGFKQYRTEYGRGWLGLALIDENTVVVDGLEV